MLKVSFEIELKTELEVEQFYNELRKHVKGQPLSFTEWKKELWKEDIAEFGQQVMRPYDDRTGYFMLYKMYLKSFDI